jgi:erythromycin esterase
VLIIESGMFDMARIRERHMGDGTSYSALAPGRMFFMYSRTEDGQRVLNYVDSTQAATRPLALVGFDISMGGDSSARELLPMLQQTLAARGSPIAASNDWATYVGIANQVVALNDTPRPDATQTAAFKRITAALDGELCATPQADDFNFTRSASFWCRIVRSVDAGRERLWGAIDLRDRTGGDNVKWLLDHPFAGKKVVLWMHSFHGINGQAFPPSGPTWVSVGTRLVQLYGDQVFMTHFTAGRGSYDAYANTGSPRTLPALRSGMIEQALATRNGPQFFAYPTDAASRDALRSLTAFEPDFGSVSPNHFGSGYQGLFFIPQTRPILPEPVRYPLVPN